MSDDDFADITKSTYSSEANNLQISQNQQKLDTKLNRKIDTIKHRRETKTQKWNLNLLATYCSLNTDLLKQ